MDAFGKTGFFVACLLGVLPLWLTPQVPMVDLPQHLHLISVLHRLHDDTTLYPAWFAARAELTPYLGYYHLVNLLHWVFPLETANRLFLSLVGVGFPLSLAFLLSSLKRPLWPALLAVPFFFGDSFGWGFVNFLSALPLSFLACGFMVRTIESPSFRLGSAVGLGLSTVATLLFHVQAFVFLGLALPWLFLSGHTPFPETFFRARRAAIGAVLPALALFVVWFGGRLGTPTEIAVGEPWKAWGPFWSKENLAYKGLAQNVSELFLLPANLLSDGRDRFGFWAALAVAAGAVLLGLIARAPSTGEKARFFRLPVLAALALGLFLFLPFDVRGYIYYLNTRYLHLFWPLCLACVPTLVPQWSRRLQALCLMPVLLLSLSLVQGFRRFHSEASSLSQLAEALPEKPLIMGLVYNPQSRVVTHPVYLHAAAWLARLGGGLSHFSFASTPHSPLRYRQDGPPTYPSEWRPWQFDEASMGQAYGLFLLRGQSPTRVFSPGFRAQLLELARAGDFVLLGRQSPGTSP